ncbi:MAG: hypothetical protein IKZ42_00125 [Clostridiales bacterium]|nr:hypothetical protein [Clostridiales bacterium]
MGKIRYFFSIKPSGRLKNPALIYAVILESILVGIPLSVHCALCTRSCDSMVYRYFIKEPVWRKTVLWFN